jgi:hypothetical protein
LQSSCSERGQGRVAVWTTQKSRRLGWLEMPQAKDPPKIGPATEGTRQVVADCQKNRQVDLLSPGFADSRVRPRCALLRCSAKVRERSRECSLVALALFDVLPDRSFHATTRALAIACNLPKWKIKRCNGEQRCQFVLTTMLVDQWLGLRSLHPFSSRGKLVVLFREDF